MNPSAYLINTARARIVDETALLSALQERWIAGAGLDVFGEEPLPPDHPFRVLDNVVATPHLGFVTVGNYRQYYETIVEDIAAWLDGAPVRLLGRASGSAIVAVAERGRGLRNRGSGRRRYVTRNSATVRVNASGCSTFEMCAASTTARAAPGIAAWIARPASGVVAGSLAPMITSVGW